MERNILFVTLSNIGDAIMTTPVLEYLHTLYPSAKFDLVCDKRSCEIFRYFPGINNIFIKEKSRGFTENYKLVKSLREKKYDVAVDLRTDFLLFFVKAIHKYRKIKNTNIHSCQKHMGSLKLKKAHNIKPKIYIPKEIEENIKSFLPKSKKRIITLGLGSNDNEKIWPTHNYLKLLFLLKKHFDLVVLVGDKNDDKISAYFEKNAKFKILNLSGKLNILETSAVIKNSNFFIGNDSGLGHISSAVETSSFTIFGKGNPKIYKPYGAKGYFYQNIEKDINLIKVNIIYKKINKILSIKNQ